MTVFPLFLTKFTMLQEKAVMVCMTTGKKKKLGHLEVVYFHLVYTAEQAANSDESAWALLSSSLRMGIQPPAQEFDGEKLLSIKISLSWAVTIATLLLYNLPLCGIRLLLDAPSLLLSMMNKPLSPAAPYMAGSRPFYGCLSDGLLVCLYLVSWTFQYSKHFP